MSEPQPLAGEPVDEPVRPRRSLRPLPKQRIFPKLDTTPYKVGEPLPNLMSCNELARALNMNPNTFDIFQREGKFKRFEHRNPIQHKRRYSGAKVTKYLLETAQ